MASLVIVKIERQVAVGHPDYYLTKAHDIIENLFHLLYYRQVFVAVCWGAHLKIGHFSLSMPLTVAWVKIVIMNSLYFGHGCHYINSLMNYSLIQLALGSHCSRLLFIRFGLLQRLFAGACWRRLCCLLYLAFDLLSIAMTNRWLCGQYRICGWLDPAINDWHHSYSEMHPWSLLAVNSKRSWNAWHCHN